MKILLVNDYGTVTAGAERITRDLRDAFRHRGHEVRVFTSRAQLIAGDSMADATCFGTTSRMQTCSSTFNPSAYFALRSELRRFQPDVVQVHMFLWQLSPQILRLLRDVPSVYYAMTYKAVCPTGLKWLPSGVGCNVKAGIACLRNDCITLPGFAPLMLQQQSWRAQRGSFSAIVACSHAVKTSLEREDIKVAEVIWPGTSVVPERASFQQPPTVTFAGRLVREKGVDILIRAFRQVRDTLPDVRLLIAGSGPEEKALRALVAALGLDQSVELHGQLAEMALNTLLLRAWVHAVPSRWAEPFGLTATESMMRGSAVVASQVGGLTESVEHGISGMHVPPGDVPALAHAIHSIVSNRAVAETMGHAARIRAQTEFSTETTTERFEALYRTLRCPV